MEAENQRKIEKAVIEILGSSDLVSTTEFEVRVAASRQLGIDLSDINHKKLVRSVVESFLLSSVEDDERGGNPPDDANVAVPKIDVDNKANRVICKLSNKRNVVVREFKGKYFVSIRECYERGGMQQSSFRGINFTTEQWSTFRNNIPAIDEAIKKMQSNLRSDLVGQQNLQISNSVVADEQNRQGYASVTATHVEQIQQVCTPNISNGEQVQRLSTSMTSHGAQVSPQVAANGEQVHQVSAQVIANGEQNQVPDTIPLNCDHSHHTCSSMTSPHELVTIEVNRFDGKNYRLWARKMELFLKQLNVVYVLTDPRPSVVITRETSADDIDLLKAAVTKWLNDDYICHHNILNSLSDSLYYIYSKSPQSAKELWEELKSVYLHEESETKRSLVKKYIEFQIVDEKSILDQVHELNRIADSIFASGMFLDDNFHVSTIIAKLPPSWQDFCINLMRVEYLPFGMLMDRIRFEEELRSQNRAGEPSNPVYSKYGCHRHTKNFGSRICNMKKPGLRQRRQEAEAHNEPALFCSFCNKRGHTLMNCRSKKLAGGEMNSTKLEAGERHYRGNNSIPQPRPTVEHGRVAN